MWTLEKWSYCKGGMGDTDVENRLVDTAEEGEDGMN